MRFFRALFLAALAAPPICAQVTAEQWHGDLAFLARELPARHVNAFAKIGRADFEARVAELDARIPKLTEAQIRTGIQRLMASLGDAHTGIWWVRGTRLLPLGFYWFEDGIFVAGAGEPYRNLLGGRLVRVGRMTVEEACERLAALVPHENEAWLKAQLPSVLTTADFLYGAGVTDTPDRARVVVEMPSGESVSAEVQAAFQSELPKIVPWFQGEDPLYRRNARRAYWATVFDGGATVYFQYNRCQEEPAQTFADFRSELSQMLSRSGVLRLVVDLRNNGGGNSGILDPWINELRTSRFNRKGRLFVIIGRRTFSSAILNAVRLRKETAAILVGEPTGGKPNHFGFIATFELPNSRARVSYSTRYFRPWADDSPSLMPDIAAALNSRDYRAGTDPALEAIRGVAPESASAYRETGNAAAREGRYDAAIAEYRKALAGADPASRASGELYLRIGEVYRRKGDVENSLASLRKAREILPDNANVMSTLALVLDSAGRKQEAREAYEAGLKLDPNDGVILNNLAYLLSLNGGDLNVALSYAQRARRLLPELVEVSDTVAWIYLKKDQPGEALGILRSVVQKAPGNATFRYHLGMALNGTGDRPGAIQALEEALRSHPSAAEEKKIQALLRDLGR